MNKNFFRIAVAAVSIGAATLCAAQQHIDVRINGRPMRFDNAQPTQQDGRVLVPLRGVFEALGADVQWDESSQRITATKGGTTVRLRIGETRARVNDRTVNLDVPPQTVDGSTMVPLRFVSESFGADVHWNEQEHTVRIDTGGGDHSGDRPLPRHRDPNGSGRNRNGGALR